MQVLLLTIGSHGDVHPFIGLGMALRNRGHQVKILTNPIFADLVQRVGLELVPLGTAEEFATLRENPDLWHRTRGFATVINSVARGFRPTYQAIMNHYIPGETVVAALSLGLAARVAQDRHGIPLASVHLSPALFRSTIAPPKLPGLYMPAWLPRSCKRMMYALGDRMVIDPLIAPPLNAFRAELGLPPVMGILNDWWHSPARVVGLFPAWFASPQEDWPKQTRLTDFPMFDEGDVSALPPQLLKFLDAGDAPVIFTPGSAMFHADEFFAASVAACVKLNRRGILLSQHAGHIPANLPASVRHFEYAPFSRILPRAAALVHHGGIGTSAQAMAAGVRQIVVPFSHDQLDNASRMQRLGVARTITPGKYRVGHLATMLSQLLTDRSITERCGRLATKFDGSNHVTETCALIEQLQPQR